MAPYRPGWAALAVFVLFYPMLAWAEIPAWVSRIESDSVLRDVFFRPVEAPQGAVLARRPPRETRAALGALIQNNPSNARLYLLRAREAERQLDFHAAESDWKRFAETLPDQAQGQRELADFYHRRLRPAAEVDALAVLARRPTEQQDRSLPAERQASWQTFERIFKVIKAHALPAALADRQYRAWLERYPEEPAVYDRFFRFLLGERSFDGAERLTADYRQAFPGDQAFPIRAEAALVRTSRSTDELFGFYKEAFEPLWPLELIGEYFTALEKEMPPRMILERLTSAAKDAPADLRAAAKVFYYHQRDANPQAAKQVLRNFREAKLLAGLCWDSEELLTVAGLLSRIRDHQQAARYFYAAYLRAAVPDEQKERGLVGLVDSLASALAASRPVAAGGDPFEMGIAELLDDRDFWDEIALLANCPDAEVIPPTDVALSHDASPPASLGRLLEELAATFPNSPRRPELHLTLLEMSAARFGPDRAVRLGVEFLASFDRATLRAKAALALGEAYARTGRIEEEWSLYDGLLQEFSQHAAGIPLGESSLPAGSLDREANDVRSPEYALLLERYVARLEAGGQTERGVALYRRELERNPRDPGIYDSFLAYLRQQRLTSELEQVYRTATEQFKEAKWYRESANWHLRQQNAAEFHKVASEAIQALSAADVEAFLDGLSGAVRPGPAAYLQLNLLAHQRFPFHLAFVRNLLSVYAQDATRDVAGWERILRQYWFYDDELRVLFFDFLSKTGRVGPEAERLRSSIPAARTGRWQQLVRENPAAAQFLAEAEVVQSRFESAVPLLLALANEYPVDVPVADRASSALQTIALANPLYIHIVFGIEDGLHYSDPRDLDRLAQLGSIWADQQQFERAATYWEQMVQVAPGRTDSYLEAAAAFSRYRLYDEALRLLRQGREQFPSEPGLYAYETGAIHEKRGDAASALAHYLQGAIAGGGDARCRDRIVALARYPQYASLVRQSTDQLTSSQNPELAALILRVTLLDAEGNREELERLLVRLAEDTTSIGLLSTLSQIAVSHQLEQVDLRARERQVILASSPAERLRLRFSYLRRLLQRQEYLLAERVREDLYREHAEAFRSSRGAVDALWEDQNFDQAFASLVAAAKRSQPAMGESETFDAALAAAAAGDPERSLLLMETLLLDHPFDPRYLEAITDTYSQTSAEALAIFYQSKAAELRDSPAPAPLRARDFAALNRSMIPALIQLGEYHGALDQYIEWMESALGDGGTVAEAISFASRHGLLEVLTEHYSQVLDSENANAHQIVAAKLEKLLEDRFVRLEVPSAAGGAARLAALLPEDLPPAPVAEEEQPPVQSASVAGSPAARAGSNHGSFCIQVGAFKTLTRASHLYAELAKLGFPARITSGDGYERVLVGAFVSFGAANEMAQDLELAGYSTWVRRVPTYDRAAAERPENIDPL